MFARVAALTLALPLLAAAQSCNTGAMQCCNSLESVSVPSPPSTSTMELTRAHVQTDSAAGAAILSALGGVALGDITGKIGLQCSPLAAVGAGAGSCKASPVCCKNNNVVRVVFVFAAVAWSLMRRMQGGAVSLGCAPVIL